MAKSKTLIAVVVGLVVVVGAAVLLTAKGPSDREMILTALDESIRASREGRPGGVLEYLSKDLKVNDEAISNRMDISKFIRESRPEVTVLKREPVIQGESATLRSPVQVKASFLNFPLDQTFDDVTITFSKESATRWLVIPATKWRVSDVRVEGLDVSGLGGG